jgi:exopolyphosphatase/guanosine-5'-triphosphate,3'-diphosphate pyrophosphatase
VATSAVREARNGEAFLARCGRETGIWPLAISGSEEARLIHLAARHSIHLGGRRALVLDIGGGSVELALGSGEGLQYAASEKLGVLRLQEDFVNSDPLSARDERALRDHVEKRLVPHAARLREIGFDDAIGTSGTILALGAMALRAEGLDPRELHHVTVRSETLRALRRRICASDVRGRLRLPGVDPSRADLLVAGSLLLETLLDVLDIRELVLCDWALREGLLLDHIQAHPSFLAFAQACPDVRRRSVQALAERYQCDEAHGRQTARLALALFDGTLELHRLSGDDRALLEHAALLHDAGHHISYASHHRHSDYLIRNGGLVGFTPAEVEAIALLSRYHRAGWPRKKDAGFGRLSKPDRRRVRVLAGLLRVADALDRSHRQSVSGLTVEVRPEGLPLRLEASGDTELELWGLPRRAALLEKLFDRPLRAEVVAQTPLARSA